MKLSENFTKSIKQVWKEEIYTNSKLLIKWGFIQRVMAWVYTYLPFWFKVLKKIENIVREEMYKLWANEVYMPALSPKESWERTNRWDVDVLFKLDWAGWNEYSLNWTHEELITPLAQKYIYSHKDLPRGIFQIQNKFRNEPRAKSGLLRWREFLMKDLYSFHKDEKDLNEYFNKVAQTYKNIYERLWLGEKTFVVQAPGWDFTTEPSLEFQTIMQWGEDIIWYSNDKDLVINEEIIQINPQNFDTKTDNWKIVEVKDKKTWQNLQQERSAEVWNIFKLYDKFSKAFNFYFTDQDWQQKLVQMWCYWIGISRLMAVLVEVFNDEDWIIWPENIAPYKYAIIPIWQEWENKAKQIYDKMSKDWKEVVLDDRKQSPGYKLKDADLVGYPYKIVVSEKTLENWTNTVELIKRSTWEKLLLDWQTII